jgi:hypothetical protein
MVNMSKRKTPYSESSSSSRPITALSQLTRTLNLMPIALLVHAASFLDKTSLVHLTLVSKLFLIVDREYTRLCYRKELVDFCELNSAYNNVAILFAGDHFADVKLWRVFKEIPARPSLSRLFSTLINHSYVPLFMALLSSDQKSAINFINYKLKSTVGTAENVTDLVFLQKKWDGETAIMLANRLGLQDFLNHCFFHLIDNAPGGKKGLMKMDKLANVLARLDTEMRAEALWLYALADICNQTTLREQISSKTHWDKTYMEDGYIGSSDGHLNLAVIAALLGNRRLMRYVLEGISAEEKPDFMHCKAWFDSRGEIYYNYTLKTVTPLVVALLDNNVELINDLLPLTLRTWGDRSQRSFFLVPLLLFYIKHKNLIELAECLKEFDVVDGRVLVRKLGVYPQRLGIPVVSRRHKAVWTSEDGYAGYNVLNVAIDSGWKEGADLLLSTAAQLIRGGKDKEILYLTICYDNLPVLKELVDRGISLFIKYSVPGYSELTIDHLEYPLITDIRVAGFFDIYNFIIEKIGNEAAIQQIDDRQKNPIDDEQDFIEMLSEYRDKLAGSSETEEEKPTTPTLSPGVLSLFSTERSSQTTSVSSKTGPAP